MKLTQGLAALILLASASAAQAEVTGTVTAASDYDFRGITQTSKNPALQGSVDYAHDSGFYAGAWASNVDFDDCCDESIEVDTYVGFAGGETLLWDAGLVYYWYPGADDIDFGEIYGSLGWKWIEGKIWYSPDFANADESAMYYEANGTFELPANFGFTAHVGYSDGGYWDEFYDGGYTDWSVGLTYSIGHFDLALKWVDGSDLADLDDLCRDFDCSGIDKDTFSTDSKAVFTISTSFPWSDGEE